MSTRFDKIGSRTHEGGIGASLENTLAPSTPSRSSIDWKGLPGDGEDEVGGMVGGERWRRKERKDSARFLTTTWVSNTTCTMRKGLHTSFNLSVEVTARLHTITRLPNPVFPKSMMYLFILKESATVVVAGRQI